MSTTVAALYTSPAIVESVSQLFQEIVPDVRLVNVVDGSLIQDVIAANEVTQAVERRLLRYYLACEDTGASVILNTCSSIGEATNRLARYIRVPIINIDNEMARKAVNSASRIAVLATLPTTLGPTVRLVQRSAEEAGTSVKIVEGLAEGAFDALISGDHAEHDRILSETAKTSAEEADVVVLAQGFMARMERDLQELIGKPVLSSPRSGIESVRAFLKGNGT